MGLLDSLFQIALNQGAKYVAEKTGLDKSLNKKYGELEEKAMKEKLSRGEITQQEYAEYKREQQKARQAERGLDEINLDED